MSFITATAPAPQTRNPWLAGFNWGIASAAAKSVTLRDLLTQIDANTKDLRELNGIIESWETTPGWVPNGEGVLVLGSAAFPSSKLVFGSNGKPLPVTLSQEMDKFHIPYTKDATVLINPTALVPTFSSGAVPHVTSYGSFPLQGVALYAQNTGFIQSSTSYNISTNTPQIMLQIGKGFFRFSDSSPAGEGIYYGDGSNYYKTSQAEIDANGYKSSAPTEAELADYISGFKDAAQQKTALAQGQQSFMVQLTSDKSNLELFATGILQRFDSLMRDLAGNLRS